MTYKPAGQWDKQGRWYPAEEEKCPFCDAIRRPTKSFPRSLWNHCHTVKHINARYNANIAKPTAEPGFPPN